MPSTIEPITDPAKVAAIAEAIGQAGRLAFDIEFVSADRHIPELSLLQVAWDRPGNPGSPGSDPSGDGVASPAGGDTVEVAMIDCLAADPAPIFALMARPDLPTIAHAARQDLGLLAARFGVAVQGLWDTQIAAAFAGLGDQIGYAKLVQQICGVKLDKGHQFTAWLDRPLSQGQLRYAADDVRFLLPLWNHLEARLRASGRLDWVGEESQRLASSLVRPVAPEEAYREVKGASGLHGRALGSLVALAAWRQREALRSNKPLSWILPDRAMVELCRHGASTENALRAVRGIGAGTTRRYGAAILDAIARGAREPPQVTQAPVHVAPSPRAEMWASVIASLVHALSTGAGIAPRFIATRADAEAVAAWFDRTLQQKSNPGPAASRAEPEAEPDVDLLRGWRRQLAGEAILAWLRGERAIIATDDDTALAAVPLPRRPAT